MLSKMGNCLKNNKDIKSNEIIISVIGLDEAGKSTLVKVLKGDKNLEETLPTVGYEPFEFAYNVGGSDSNIKVYDLGGGSRVRDIWKHYLAESFGFVFVIDSSNRSRLNECKSVFASFIENEKVSGKPILILGNKQDMPNALDESEIVHYLNVEELVNRFQIPCRIETCVATKGVAKNVDPSLKTGFDWLIMHLKLNYGDLKARTDIDVERQKSEESRIRKEKSDRVRQSRSLRDSENSYDDDHDPKESPWKALTDLKNKDSKLKAASSNSYDSKLSTYDRQLLEDMRVSSPKPNRLTTIDEEKSKFLRNKFLKSNKLNPYDDKSDMEPSSRNTSWAITDHQTPKRTLPALDNNRPTRGRYES